MTIDFNQAAPQDQPRRHRSKIDVADVRERLNASAESFVRWLFPDAVFTKGEARIGGVQGEPGTSLSIELAGPNVGKWRDHATGAGGNDLIGLYGAYRGFSGKADFPLLLNEIVYDFLGDSIQFRRSSSRPTPHEQIEATKKTFADQREDMIKLGAPVRTFHYYDASRNIIAIVCRYEPGGARESKTFRPYTFKLIDGATRWISTTPDPRPLYRLPEISTASEVVLVEGEGKADALAALGLVVTSAMGGANADEHTDWTPLAGKTVTIWPDNDDAGHNFATRVTVILTQLGCTVLIVQVPADKPQAWDVVDCIDEGGDVRAILAGAAEADTEAKNEKDDRPPPPPGDDQKKNDDPAGGPNPNIDPDTGMPLVLSAKEFVGGYTPPAYLIDGVMQRGYLYSLTARTSHGKTAVAMYMAQCIARGLPMHGRTVKRGTVLLLAGENPDDIRARFIVLGDFYGFNPETLRMQFIAGVISVFDKLPIIRAVAATIPDLVLVIVDTAAAYFPGDETNSNAQQGNYARLLRELTKLPGKPATLVCCHPVKNATQDNLIPMGGSAFINEMDGNLTLWADAEKQTSLHWLGKFRGPEFDPMSFDLRVTDSAKVHDAEGRLMPSVVAVPVTDADAEAGMKKQENDENRVLLTMADYRDASFGLIAVKTGLSKAKVGRIMKCLLHDKLVEKHRSSNGKYRLTEKGKREIGV